MSQAVGIKEGTSDYTMLRSIDDTIFEKRIS